MYIEKTFNYYDGHGRQRSSRARFLILMQSKDEPKAPMRAIVRKVALHQFGHFMMGMARIKGQSITLSGSYGGDGLPVRVPHAVYQMGVILPSDLYDAWNHGGGWNSAGKERNAMRRWANENIMILTRDPSDDKTIESFMDAVHYVNRLGFSVKPGFPGWIIQAQERLASAANKLWQAANKGYPYTVHYYRKEKTFVVNNSQIVDASRL